MIDNDFTKYEPNNVSLIFDNKKEAINFSWSHYCEYPEMKKYLTHVKVGPNYGLVDSRTNKVVMEASFSLEMFLK